jgi:hypothetical protein
LLDRVSLCSLGWPRTSDPPVSASQMLGLQAYTTMLAKDADFELCVKVTSFLGSGWSSGHKVVILTEINEKRIWTRMQSSLEWLGKDRSNFLQGLLHCAQWDLSVGFQDNYFLFVVLGFRLRALHLLDRCPSAWAKPPAPGW